MATDTFGLISIIMAAYNAERTIEEAARSVLAQTFKNYELIVINDCSTDATASIVDKLAKTDSRIRLFTNDTNFGVSRTRHKGVENAKGEWLAFLDSDDVWTADKLEKQIKLQRDKKASLLFTGSAFMDEDGKLIDWRLHVPAEIGYRKLLKQNLISNSSVLVRKELYMEHEAIGDEMHEDFACWLGILKKGYKAYGVDEPLLVYRLSVTSKSGNKIKAAKMNWNTYRNIGLNVMSAVYYMIWYMVNGIIKYRNLRDC